MFPLKLEPVFSSKAKIKPCARSTVAALCATQRSDACTGNVNKQWREQNFCIEKGVCYISPPLPISCSIYTAVLCKMCRGVFYYYFLVIYLPKIAQHLFCGELLSQSFTVALIDAKGGHGPCSVILNPFVSTAIWLIRVLLWLFGLCLYLEKCILRGPDLARWVF